MKPACMTPEEYAAWLAANRQVRGPAATPCSDCLLPFAEEQRAQGTCDGEPGVQHRTEHECDEDGLYCRNCQRDAARAVAVANHRAKRLLAIEQAVRLAQEGHNQQVIASLMGVAPSTVSHYLRDAA